MSDSAPDTSPADRFGSEEPTGGESDGEGPPSSDGWFSAPKKLWGLLTPGEEWRLVGVFVAMVGAAVGEVIGVGSILPFLDLLTNPEAVQSNRILAWAFNALEFEDSRSFLFFVGAGVLVVILGTQMFGAFARWIQLRFNYNLEHDLSSRLLETYLRKTYPYHRRRSTSTLTKNVLHETGTIISGIVNPALSFVSNMLIALGILGLLLWLHPLITIGLVGFVGGAYALIYLYARNRLHRAGEIRNRANKERFQIVSEGFGGIKELKVLGRESSILDRFMGPSRTYADMNTKGQAAGQLPPFVLRALTFGGLMGVLLVLMATGSQLAELVPTMGLFALAGYRLMPQMEGILAALTEFRYREDLLTVIHHDLVVDREPYAEEQLYDRGPLSFEEVIELRNISFHYPDDERLVVDDVSLELPKRTTVAFVGETGAGKSTLMDIILGLLRPSSGSLRIDGETIDRSNVRRWRQNIGYVPQEIYLLDASIASNIAFGVPEDEVDMDAVERAARAAHIHTFIEGRLSEGYHTVVGERGVRLSGGQRQRIGIARALYHDPPVLAMDEATSDIDSVTERQISLAIEELAQDKTLIIIAHRLNTIKNSDIVHVIEDGRIIESGRYEELMADSRHFQSLAHGISQ